MNKTTWQEKMLADLLVAGMSKRTQTAYLRAVRQLRDYYNGTDPKQLSEQQVKDYLLWLRTEKRAAPGTLRIAIGGLRFFFRQTAVRDWKVLDKFRIPAEKKLPEVLSLLEVHRIMHAIRLPRFHVYFWTVYSCGLRLNEALALQVGDIDAERTRIHVRRGKGAKDRFETDLDELRAVILQSMRDSEPDLELIDWTVPVLRSSMDAGPKCPTCGEPLTFASFIRIRPPPLEWRRRNFD